MNPPSTKVNKEMYAVCMKTGQSWSVWVTHESASGDTVLTEHGQIMRTNTKFRKIFNSADWAHALFLALNGFFTVELLALEKKLRIKFGRDTCIFNKPTQVDKEWEEWRK
jgi:hypothetical protein